MLLLEGTKGLDRLFMTGAKAADADTIAILQYGGFVYLTYDYSATKPFVNPAASVADGSGSNLLKTRAIYPVFIVRPQPGTPRTDFKPIGDDGLISIIQDHGFECFFTSDSYVSGGGTYDEITAGDALKVLSNANTSDRPKLVVDNSGAGTLATTVAIALSAPVAGEIRVMWL